MDPSIRSTLTTTCSSRTRSATAARAGSRSSLPPATSSTRRPRRRSGSAAAPLEGVGRVSPAARASRRPHPAASRSTTTTPRRAAGSRRRPRRDDGLRDGNAIGAAPANVPLRWRAHVGARDQLAYYSNYGSRVDLAAPGGARRYQIPRLRRRRRRRPLRRVGLLRRARRKGPDLHRLVRRLHLQLGLLHGQGRRLRLAPGHLDGLAERGRCRRARPLGRPDLRGARGARTPACRDGEALARELHGTERPGEPRSSLDGTPCDPAFATSTRHTQSRSPTPTARVW